MGAVPLRLGHKLGAILVVLMLGVAVATATFVFFGFERTQDSARRGSQAGLEALGLRLIAEMAQSQSESGSRQTDQVSRLAEEIARYLTLSQQVTLGQDYDGSGLARGARGQIYDPDPNRASDLFLPSGVPLSDAVMADIRDSASLDGLFSSLFSGDGETTSLQPVALFFHSTEHVIRYYPPIGLETILPPDLKLESDLRLAGPNLNPGRTIVWSDPYQDEAGQGFLVTAMAPVYIGDAYRGRVGVDVPMDWLASHIGSVKPTPSGFAFYVDRTGDLLASGGEGILNRNLAVNEDLVRVFEAMELEGNGAARVRLDGQEYFIAYSGFGSVGGSFGVAAPIAEITQEAAAIASSIDEEGNRTIIVLLAAIAVLFVVALIGAALMNRQVLLRPIEALVEGTQAVRRGALDVTIDVRGRDEMALLAQSFNLMTAEIRERREALEAEIAQRQLAQEELQALFSAMTDVVLVIDRQGRFARLPSSGAPGGLMAPENLLGRALHEAMAPGTADLLLAKVREAIDTRDTVALEYAVDSSDGELWLSAAISPVTSDTAMVVQRDITSIKHAFNQLSEQEEQYRAVLEAATDGVVVTDAETDLVVAANPAFCRMHGYDDMVGMQPFDFIHPESHHLFLSFRDTLLRGDEFRCRAMDTRRDGSAFDVDVIGRSFTYHGKPALLGVVRDVTEEVRALSLLEQRVTERTREIERRRAVAEGLRDLLAVVNSGRNLGEILEEVVIQARRLLESDASSILLPDESGQHLATSNRSGRDEEDFHARLHVAGSAVGVAFTQRRPATVFDVANIYNPHNLRAGQRPDEPAIEEAGNHLRVTYLPLPPEEDQATRVQKLGQTFRGFLAVPLVSSERSYGALSLNYREPRKFSDEEIALAVAFADQAALAIDNARLSERVQAAAALDERQRLARELHDAVTQTLFSTSLIAEVVPGLWESKPELARERLEDLRRMTRGALAEMRTLLVELRPGSLAELSLAELLRQLAEATAGRTNLKVTVEIADDLPARLPPEVQLALYRIAQEAVNNIIRHAEAGEASIRLKPSAQGGILLTLRDDGKGFDPAAVPGGHLGVGIMRERAQAIAAAFEIESAIGQGTTINIEWRTSDGNNGHPS